MSSKPVMALKLIGSVIANVAIFAALLFIPRGRFTGGAGLFLAWCDFFFGDYVRRVRRK